MTLSIVIAVRNMAATLPRAVLSALEADDIVLVYDASTDDTWHVVQDLATWYANVRYIHPQSSVPIGVCAARNIGVTAATGELIIPLDADDYFLPGGIQALKDAWRANTFVYGPCEKDDGTIVTPPPLGMLKRKNVTQATFLFSKQDFIRVGGYDPRLTVGAEDYALMRAFVRAGLTGTQTTDPVYHYTDNPSGRATDCHRHWPLIVTLLDDWYGLTT
jgi:glycosyltransferase involved in cell wall biosynthesis